MSMLSASLQAWALSFAGMTSLAFAMDRHYAQWTAVDEVPAVQRRLWRCAGVLLLAATWVPAVSGWSASVSTVVVLGFWSLGALLTAGWLAVSARWLPRAAMAAAVLGIGSCLWSLMF